MPRTSSRRQSLDRHDAEPLKGGQKRRVITAVKLQMRRRSAVESVIGQNKNEHRLSRNHLAGEHGDAINPILAAAGYNFSPLLRWLKMFVRLMILALQIPPIRPLPENSIVHS